MSTGVKFDAGKTDWTFLKPQVVEKILSVFKMGAEKYGRGNYEHGIAYSRLFSAAMRHLWAWWRGEEKDTESGLNHLYHAAWNVLVLIEFVLDRKYAKFDDRVSKSTSDVQSGQQSSTRFILESESEGPVFKLPIDHGTCSEHTWAWNGQRICTDVITIFYVCTRCGATKTEDRPIFTNGKTDYVPTISYSCKQGG